MRNRIARLRAAIRVARQVYREPMTVGINIAGAKRPEATRWPVKYVDGIPQGGGGGGTVGPARWDHPAV